ncbi:MAG: hypothetical protein AAF791_14760 [Bacteroidota bacterium]
MAAATSTAQEADSLRLGTEAGEVAEVAEQVAPLPYVWPRRTALDDLPLKGIQSVAAGHGHWVGYDSGTGVICTGELCGLGYFSPHLTAHTPEATKRGITAHAVGYPEPEPATE